MQSLNHRYVFKFYFTRIFASMEFSNNFSNTKYISHLKSNNSKVKMQLLSLVAEKKNGRVSFPFGVGEILSVVSFPYKYCLSLWFIYRSTTQEKCSARGKILYLLIISVNNSHPSHVNPV